MVTSVEASSSCDAVSDHESQSGDSKDSETSSDSSTRLKVAAAAALAGITYYFGQSTVMKTRLGSLGNHGHYFPMGYGRPPGAESMPEPQADEAIMFEDFFSAGLHMPPHSVLLDILRKFRVQLHQLMLNAIVQISMFTRLLLLVGAVLLQMSSLSTTSYTTIIRRFNLWGPRLLTPLNLAASLFTLVIFGVGGGLPLLCRISGLVGGMATGSIAEYRWSKQLMSRARETSR
jgi:hypothetical protein